MARQGLEDDLPEAYKVLDNFSWTPEEIEEIMSAVQDGEDPEDAAAVVGSEANQDRVAEWTEGIK